MNAYNSVPDAAFCIFACSSTLVQEKAFLHIHFFYSMTLHAEIHHAVISRSGSNSLKIDVCANTQVSLLC